MSNTSKKPTHYVYVVNPRDGARDDFWFCIGAAWYRKETDTLSIKLDALPLSREIVIRPPYDAPEAVETDATETA